MVRLQSKMAGSSPAISREIIFQNGTALRSRITILATASVVAAFHELWRAGTGPGRLGIPAAAMAGTTLFRAVSATTSRPITVAAVSALRAITARSTGVMRGPVFIAPISFRTIVLRPAFP
jgi:hypothetical protein